MSNPAYRSKIGMESPYMMVALSYRIPRMNPFKISINPSFSNAEPENKK
tara:strand:- start:612 stop:758 length:147 start_codon:yes stop_codon:yes gene_type:complete